MVRDINAGRFQANGTLVLVTHGLALRIFLMRWFHWTVEQFLQVGFSPFLTDVVLTVISVFGSLRQGAAHRSDAPVPLDR